VNHIEALLALAPEGVTIYDTEVPPPLNDAGEPTPLSYPYLVLEAPAFREDAITLSRASLVVDDYFTIRAVGEGIEQARWLANLARAAFDRARPNVTDYTALATLDSTSPFITDYEVDLTDGGHPTFAVDRYRYRATPA
jgi:hypothetical protein